MAKTTPEVMTIDLTPTDDGYEGLIRLFVENIIGDVADNRKKSVTHLLGTIIDIATYFGATDVQRGKRIATWYVERGKEPD